MMSEEVRNQKTINNNQNVMVPNDPQIQFQKERSKNGIPISDELHEVLFKDKNNEK